MNDLPAQGSGPIADLSYRNYDGPLLSPTFRWWTIARTTMRMATKNKWLWIMSVLAAAYPIIMIIELFVIDRIAQSSLNGVQVQKAFLGRLEWKEQFLHTIGFAQMPSMIIALVVGAGAIANDNRANALLVYLSKPCSRFDYAFGKWVGVFLTLVAALAIPSLGFYAYGALSFRDHGFFDDRYILPQMLAIIPLCAALNASLVLAISSVSKQGRLAGAVFAGIYFLGYFFTQTMSVVWQMSHSMRFGRHGARPVMNEVPLVGNLFYASDDGLQIGLAKAILHAKGVNAFGTPSSGFRAPAPVPAPPLVPCLAIVLAIVLASLAITWKQVRAVEVVG